MSDAQNTYKPIPATVRDQACVLQTVRFLRKAMREGGVGSPEFEITVPIHRNPEENPVAYAYTDPGDIIVVARGSAKPAPFPPPIMEDGRGGYQIPGVGE